MAWSSGMRQSLGVLLGVLLFAFQHSAVAADKATLRLDWTIAAYHAPFVLGVERGYYKDAGIDLDVLEGKGSGTAIQLVGRGNDTFGFVDGAAIANSVSNGIPAKMVMGILNRTMMGVLVRKDGPIKTVQDLRGKTLTVTAGDAPSLLLPAFLAANNVAADSVKVTAVDASAKFSLVGRGAADGSATYPALCVGLMQKLFGVQIANFDFADSGIVIAGFGIVASNKTIEEHPQLVERFVAATARSWKAAKDDPAAAISAVVKRYPQVQGREAEFENTLQIALQYIDTRNTAGRPWGWMSPDDWTKTQDFVVKYLGAKAPSSIDAYFTDQFVK